MATVNFSQVGAHLSVTIQTERLHIRSVEPEYLDYYAALYGDKNVMKTIATGQIKTKAEIQERINNIWVKRWRENDPFSGLAVFEKSTGNFLGHIVLGHGELPGEAEVSYLFHQKYWGNRIGTEAVTAVIKEYAPALAQKGYTVNGARFEKIVATAKPENKGSWRILQNLGMHLVKTEKKFGALRHHYSIDVSELQKITQEKSSNSWYRVFCKRRAFASCTIL